MKEMLKPPGDAKLMSYVQKNEVLSCGQEGTKPKLQPKCCHQKKLWVSLLFPYTLNPFN